MDGQAHCWGENSYGQTDVPEGDFVSVGSGEHHACGLLTSGKVVCWGNTGPENISEDLVNPPDDLFRLLGTSGIHSCGVTVDGEIKCWGDNSSGQLEP